MRLAQRRQARHADHDAFMSYSRTDVEFAERLQQALERFAKPWRQPRSLKVFRDMSSLTPDGGMWGAIERGLERSDWFLLLASPEAASSPWVERELSWWLEHRSIDRILIVVVAGDDADADGDTVDDRAAVIPPALRGAFSGDEPGWVDGPGSGGASADDPAFHDLVLTLIAAVKQLPKDTLAAVERAEHRRTIRIAITGVATLMVLLVAAVVAGLLALDQRDTARSQTNLAFSRLLASASGSELSSNLDVSLLLAVEAARRDDNAQTHSAVLRAALASPQLDRYFSLPAQVTAVAGSGNGRVIVAGLRDGRVMRWDRDRTPTQVAKVPRAVKQVAVDETGATAVVTDGDILAEEATTLLIRDDAEPQALEVPAGQVATSVAVSPSGRTVMVLGNARVAGARSSVHVVDVRTGKVMDAHDAGDSTAGVRVLLPSDEETVLFDAGYGNWRRFAIGSWERIDNGGVGFGTHEAAGEPSADGGYMTATNGEPEIPIWRMHGTVVHDRPQLVANAPINNPDDLALSPDGRHLAVTDTGVIYVARTGAPGDEQPPPVALEGSGSVEIVRFLGDASRLLSVTGSNVALWNLRQVDRLARSVRVPLGSACSACAGALIAMSPDGASAALTSDGGATAALVDLRRRRGIALPDPELDYIYLPPVWRQAPMRPVFPISPVGDAVPPSPALPGGALSWQRRDVRSEIVAASAAGGDRAILVDDRGRTSIHRSDDGQLIRTISAHPDIELGDVTVADADVSPSGDRVATLLDDQVSIVDLAKERVVKRFRAPGGARLAIAAGRVFVQHDDGTLDVRRVADGRVERTIAGDRSYIWAPVPNPGGTMLARQRQNGEIALVDVDSGSVLAVVPRNRGSGGAKIGVEFSPNGERLITVTDERTYKAGAVVIDRDLSRDALIRSACRTAGGELTEAQWQRFVGAKPNSEPTCG